MTILELFELAIDLKHNDHHILEVGVIQKALADVIFIETGVDVSGFMICFDIYGIRHAVERHGNMVIEDQRGQIALTAYDFLKIEEVIALPDSIRHDFRGVSNYPSLKETLVFVKKIEHQYFVAMEIRRVTKKGKQSRLVFQTMYIRKSAAS